MKYINHFPDKERVIEDKKKNPFVFFLTSVGEARKSLRFSL